jgi:hypothetical protein
LDAYDSDSRSHGVENHGISEFLRTLMRQGYLPLLAPDLAPDRLEGCGLLVSIAPAQPFSLVERGAIHKLVDRGGIFLCMVGAEESRASAPLLAEFGFKVPRSPVPPGEEGTEPEPSKVENIRLGKSKTRQFAFYAGWPVYSTESGEDRIVATDGKDWAYIQRRGVGAGSVVVVGDTYFATNENLQWRGRNILDRIYFWRWLFNRIVPGRPEWVPPEATPAEMSANAVEEDEGDEEGME